MYEAIILAGGFGTRLRSVVADVPKPMAPVAGKPFLAWQLDYLIAAGVRRFILSVGYRAEVIEACFGDRYRDAEVCYAREDEPLGTGGAIRLALGMAKAERVFVLNGDSLCSLDLAALRSKTAGRPDAIGMCIKHVPDAGRYGAVSVDAATGVVLAFAEKAGSAPGWINAGVYDLPRTLMDDLQLAAPFSFEKEVLQKAQPGNLMAQAAGDFFIDIGIPEDYTRAQTEIPAWIADGTAK